METPPWPRYGDVAIVAARPSRKSHDPFRPQAFFLEQEFSAAGTVDDVATLFLTNKECPFRCLMCDLWQNTLVDSVPAGAIPAQIDFALSELFPADRPPTAKHIKLYNSGNFFDHRAIPRIDYAPIAERVRHFETVIVENHPRLCGADCFQFQSLLRQNGGIARLEVAIGLETVHPQVLDRLNKRMTLEDVERALTFLQDLGIATRAFLLLRPPFLSEEEGIDWCLKSVQFAFDRGVGCCSIIPVRAGNGIMEKLQTDGWFSPPSLEAFESTFDEALKIAARRGRVFVDTWDLPASASLVSANFEQRHARLRQMNLTQKILPRVADHD